MNTKRTLSALILVGVGLIVGTAVTWMATRPSDPASQAKIHYHCPMHPEIVRDEPGDCPVCGMRLVATGAPVATAERKVAFYRNPMDPTVHSPVPMKDSMGMDYLPVYADEVNGSAPVPGMADITIDPAYQRLIGVRTAAAEVGPVSVGWTTPAKVAVDETRVRKITTKTGGFVDRLFVDFMGKPVKKGQPLFALYSPELYSAQQDLALAAKSEQALGADGASLLRSAEQRLRLWDVLEAEIQRLRHGGEAQRDMLFSSPVTGVVTAKNVVQGGRLLPGDTPFEVTDLSSVWVMADAYSADLAKVAVGNRATFTTPAIPGRTFTGRVAFIDPVLDPQTRTARVRLAFANPEGLLRPETYGQATFQGNGLKGLRIPFSAILDNGDRKVVFVDQGEGRFSPREIKVGAQDADWAEVLSGLEAGDLVAVKANFLLDSEARRRAALAGGTQ